MQMLKNPIVRFLGIFLLSYFVLTALYNFAPVKEGVNGMLRGVTAGWLNTTMPKLEFSTRPDRQGAKVDDNKMMVDFKWTEEKINQVIEQARRTGQANIEVPHRFISYLLFEFFIVPIIFLLSLNISSPVKRKEKWLWGGVGLLVLMAFLLIKLRFLTMFSVSKAQIDVYELGHSAMTTLQWLASLMTMGFSVIIAFFIWLGLLFPKSQLKDQFSIWLEKLAKE
jgi:hypothetical protein